MNIFLIRGFPKSQFLEFIGVWFWVLSSLVQIQRLPGKKIIINTRHCNFKIFYDFICLPSGFIGRGNKTLVCFSPAGAATAFLLNFPSLKSLKAAALRTESLLLVGELAQAGSGFPPSLLWCIQSRLLIQIETGRGEEANYRWTQSQSLRNAIREVHSTYQSTTLVIW